MRKNKHRKVSAGKIIWHLFVIALSVASLVGFIPCSADSQSAIRLLFMGFTLIGAFYEVVNYLFADFKSKNNLEKYINEGLSISKEDRIDEMTLFQIENNLDNTFEVANGQYHIIIISSCVSNEGYYINAMWKNISRGVKYLYVTPDNDQDFINTLIGIFLDSRKGNPTEIYKLVTSHISHICEKELFVALPETFDLWLGLLDKNHRISMDSYKGYVCFSAKTTEYGSQYLYASVSKGVVERIFNRYNNCFEMERLLHPYYSDKLEMKNSPIDGKGLFIKSGASAKKGELLIIKGGHELHRADMVSKTIIDSYLPIGNDLFLAAKTEDEEEQIKLYINHSCNPNVGIQGDRAFVAMRDISSGEEITIDYALVDDEEYEFTCKCASPLCRKKITGRDWKNPELQKRYGRKYFSKYLQDRMK